SPTRACRGSSAIRSIWSRASTTGWRCPPCSPSWLPCPANRRTSCGGASCCRTWAWASWLMPSEGKRLLEREGGHPIPSHQKSLYALGVAFATYGITVISPRGNGFIAVFVAAIVLGLRRPDLRLHFEQRADELVEIVKLGIFVVFGSLLTLDALGSNGWAALGLVAVAFLIARPVAVWIALIGTSTDRQTRLFMGWFGPKGVATMAFSLLVLDQHIAAGERIFDLAALVVFCSIVVHGLTDTPGAHWIARHAEKTHR